MVCPNCKYDNAYNHSLCIRCGYELVKEEIEVLELDEEIEHTNVDIDTYLEDIPDFLNKTKIKNDEAEKKKENLSKMYGIISIALPTISIVLYIFLDISKIFCIALCLIGFMMACICEDRHKNLSLVGKTLSGTNAGFVFLELLLEVFKMFLTLYL